MAMPRMNPAELNELLEEDREKVTVIDVRSKANFDKGHVPGAVHIPVGHMKERVPDLPKDGLIVTY